MLIYHFLKIDPPIYSTKTFKITLSIGGTGMVGFSSAMSLHEWVWLTNIYVVLYVDFFAKFNETSRRPDLRGSVLQQLLLTDKMGT